MAMCSIYLSQLQSHSPNKRYPGTHQYSAGSRANPQSPHRSVPCAKALGMLSDHFCVNGTTRTTNHGTEKFPNYVLVAPDAVYSSNVILP